MKPFVRITSITMSALIVCLGAGFAQAETPEELLKKLEDISKKSVKSSRTIQTSKMTSQFMEMNTTTTSVHLNKGDKSLFRAETKGKMKYMGAPEAQDMHNISVNDGEFLWVETKQMGMTQVMKQKMPEGSGNFGAILDTVKKGTATVKPDEEVNGHKCAVLEIATGEGDQAMTMTYWFSRKYGAVMKMVMKGGMVGETVTETTEFKVDVDVDESQFKYTPPAGAQVQDMTGG